MSNNRLSDEFSFKLGLLLGELNKHLRECEHGDPVPQADIDRLRCLSTDTVKRFYAMSAEPEGQDS